MKLLMTLAIFIMAPLYALAEVLPPETVEEMASMIPLLIQAIANGQWLAAVSLLVIFVTFIAKKYVLPKIGLGNGLLPLVAIAVGILGSIGASVFGGAEPLAATLAIMAGPVGISLYDALIKYFLPKEA